MLIDFLYNVCASDASRIRVSGSWMRSAQKCNQHFDEKRTGFV